MSVTDDWRGIDMDGVPWKQRIKDAQRDADATGATGNLAAAMWAGSYARDVAALIKIIAAYQQLCKDGDT